MMGVLVVLLLLHLVVVVLEEQHLHVDHLEGLVVQLRLLSEVLFHLCLVGPAN